MVMWCVVPCVLCSHSDLQCLSFYAIAVYHSLILNATELLAQQILKQISLHPIEQELFLVKL